MKLLNQIFADQIYQDRHSGKFVLAGIFHQLNVPTLPTVYQVPFGMYVSIIGIDGKYPLLVEVQRNSPDSVSHKTHELEIECADPEMPVDFSLLIPPFPIEEEGEYVFRITVDGKQIGERALQIYLAKSGGA